MKRLCIRLCSVLLVFALLTVGSASALAANSVPPSIVTLDKKSAIVYLHGGESLPVRLSSTVQPSDFDGTLSWTVPDGAKVVVTSDQNGASVSAAAGAVNGDTAVVTVTASAAGVSKSAACAVTIKNDAIKSKTFGPFTAEVGKTIQAKPIVTWISGVTDSTASGYYVDDPSIATVDSQGNVKALAKGATKLHAVVGGETLTADLKTVGVEGISLTPGTLNLSVGDAPAVLTATIRPAGLSYAPVFTTSDATVAAVSSDGKVTAKKAGAATITAKITDSSGTEYSASCTVSVSALTGNVTDTTDAGTPLTFKKIRSEITDRYTKAGGSGNPTIAFSSVGSASVGTLYETSAKSKIVESGYYGSLSLMENMYFIPSAAGRYVIAYTVSSPGRPAALTGSITIEVTSAVKNIQIGLPADEDYVFDDASSNGLSGTKIISDALGPYGSIRFGSTSSVSGAGTLYVNAQSGSRAVRSGTVVNSGEVGALFFSPDKNVAYQIAFSAYSGSGASGTLIASGTLTIGTGTDSLNVAVRLDSVSAYRFDAAARRSSASAESLLRAAVNANVGSSAWKYIKFESTPLTNTCGGALYTDSTAAYAVNANTPIASSDLASLYFVPAQTGAFELGYSVYSDDLSAPQLAGGKLRIVVSNLASGTAALYLNTTLGGTLTFRDSDFETWFVGRRTSSYHLEYVQFTGITHSYGTLYVGAERLTPGSGHNYYTAGYFKGGSASRCLADVSFTAPARAGHLEVSFVCHGRSGSNGTLVQESGVLRIYASAGSVPEITRTFGGTAPILLKESDFSNVYRSAMNVSAVPTFYVQLMELPSAGTLYENYNSSAGRGTELTSSTVDLSPYYVGGGAGTQSASRLAYVPGSRGTGSYSVHYIAFSEDGVELYAGTITFRYDASSSTLNVTDGYTFRPEDVCDDPSALYVVFSQPLLGKLYLNYKNGRGTPLTDNTRLYFSSAANGSSVDALTYIPLCGMDGTIYLEYTVYTAHSSYSDKVALKTEKKTTSATFTDVPATGAGSWAANAIDFASKWGLVLGTGSGKFSPDSTMRRCDLVLILYRNAGSPAVSGTLSYTDVPADAYYRDSALWAANKGIMEGVVTGTKYDPSGAITRQDFTRILYNYARATGGNLTGSASLSGYTDASKLASYAKDAMAWAVGRGYINGTSATTLSPAEKATRAQIATLLHRYLTL